jgi:hypothetical protein
MLCAIVAIDPVNDAVLGGIKIFGCFGIKPDGLTRLTLTYEPVCPSGNQCCSFVRNPSRFVCHLPTANKHKNHKPEYENYRCNSEQLCYNAGHIATDLDGLVVNSELTEQLPGESSSGSRKQW